jgi:ADP-heptose:LPS heptosyltransferase
MDPKNTDLKKARDKMKISHPKHLNLKEISSVLMFAPFKVEDFILATPAISALKEAISPQGKITAIVNDETKSIAHACDAISESRSISMTSAPKTFFSVNKDKYDLFISFEQDNAQAFMLGALSNAKAKIAYEPKNPNKAFQSVFNLALRTIDHPQHKIIKFMSLVRFVGANSYDFMPRLHISEEDKLFSLDFIKKNNINCDNPIVGIHPTLNDPKKRWSFNKFTQLMSNLIEKDNCTILAFHHKDENAKFSEFMHITKNKAIEVDVQDYMKIAAISRFLSCFVCNETDFMHVVAPFTNIIAIWGDTDPENNRPTGSHHDIINSADGIADSVPVSRVLESVRKYIHQR